MTSILDLLLALLLGLSMLGTESAMVEPMQKSKGVRAPIQAEGDAATANPMLDLLAFAPDVPSSRKWLTVGDPAAWYAATGIAPVESMADLRARPEGAVTQFIAMTTATVPPESLAINNMRASDLRNELGFSFFDAQQFLELGFALNQVSAIVLDVPADTIRGKLLDLGYEERVVAGGTLFALRDDYEIDLAASPLRRMATYNRIVLLDGDPDKTVVLIARGTPEIESAIDAVGRPANSLAGDPYYAALASALATNQAGVDGALVGVIFQGEWMPTDPAVWMRGVENPQEKFSEVQEWYAANPLDPWVTSAFATTVDGEDVTLSVLLAFAPSVDAETNADALATRAAEWRGVLGVLPGDKIWEVVGSGATNVDGVPIAWVNLQPTPDFAARINWYTLINRREDAFVAPTLSE